MSEDHIPYQKKKISQNLKKKIKKRIASLGINISQVDAPFKATKR